MTDLLSAVDRVLATPEAQALSLDSDADLDDVVPHLLDSAYGFAGQKCSAASRVLVHERVADALTERLRGAIERNVPHGNGPNGNHRDTPASVAKSAPRVCARKIVPPSYVVGCVASPNVAPGSRDRKSIRGSIPSCALGASPDFGIRSMGW